MRPAHALRRLDIGTYGLFRPGPWNWKLVRLLARIAWPAALLPLLEGRRWFASFPILERPTTEAIAFSNIISAC